MRIRKNTALNYCDQNNLKIQGRKSVGPKIIYIAVKIKEVLYL